MLRQVLAASVFVLAVSVTAQGDVSPPPLTTQDQADIAILNLMAQLAQTKRELAACTGKLDAASVTEQLEKTRRAIEARHPGFVWDAATGTLRAPGEDR